MLFTLSSAACGFAPSLGWLVFFRVLQGLGGGGLQPSEQAILADTFELLPARDWRLPFTASRWLPRRLSVQRLAGGLPTTSIALIFWINIPVGILSMAMTNQFVQDRT